MAKGEKMSKKYRSLITAATLTVTTIAAAAKATKKFIDYQKLNNKDIFIKTPLFKHKMPYVDAEGIVIEDMKPVIRKSICTGEMEAGFKDTNGKFTSYQLINSDRDIEAFKIKYGINGDIPIEY